MSVSCCWRGSLWSLSQGLMCQVSSLQSQCFISCVINVYPGRVTLKLGKLLTLWNQLCHPLKVLAWINSYHDSCHILLFLILPLLCRCHLTFCWKHMTFFPLSPISLFIPSSKVHPFQIQSAGGCDLLHHCLLSRSNSPIIVYFKPLQAAIFFSSDAQVLIFGPSSLSGTTGCSRPILYFSSVCHFSRVISPV